MECFQTVNFFATIFRQVSDIQTGANILSYNLTVIINEIF